MKNKVIFITGATGFLGSHLTYEFLEQGHIVIALVRENKEAESPSFRLLHILSNIGSIDDAFKNNLIIVQGNISDLDHYNLILKVREQIEYEIDEVWHCAVTFKIKKKEKDEVKAININGTKTIMEFVLAVNANIPPRVFHVSTAYCGGNEISVVPEDRMPTRRDFRSLYEWSKYEGESIVESYFKMHDLDVTIFRPSIIIGSNASKFKNDSGYYSILKKLFILKRNVEIKLGDNFNGTLAFRVAANPDTRLNLVTIDYSVNVMTMISNKKELKENSLKIFNVVNDSQNQPTTYFLKKIILKDLNISGIELVDRKEFEKAPMSTIEQYFERAVQFQAPYLNADIMFTTEKLRHYIPQEVISPPVLDEEYMSQINMNYLEQLGMSF